MIGTNQGKASDRGPDRRGSRAARLAGTGARVARGAALLAGGPATVGTRLGTRAVGRWRRSRATLAEDTRLRRAARPAGPGPRDTRRRWPWALAATGVAAAAAVAVLARPTPPPPPAAHPPRVEDPTPVAPA